MSEALTLSPAVAGGEIRRRRSLGVRLALVWEVVTGGVRELWAHKLRSMLTLTLLMLGVFALVVMTSVLDGVKDKVSTGFAGMSWDGTLYLTVPNFGSLEARVFGEHWAGLRIPEHLHHFTPRALRRLIEESGFRIVTWRTDTVLSITQETIGTWERASGGGWWRRLFVRLPGYMLAPATLAADLCGRGQMLRIVAVCK